MSEEKRRDHKPWCNSVWWGVPPYHGQHTRGCQCPQCCGKEPSPECDCKRTDESPATEAQPASKCPVFRVGARVPLNVYEVDRLMFQAHTSEDASRLVSLLNAGLEKAPAERPKVALTREQVQGAVILGMRGDMLVNVTDQIMRLLSKEGK